VRALPLLALQSTHGRGLVKEIQTAARGRDSWLRPGWPQDEGAGQTWPRGSAELSCRPQHSSSSTPRTGSWAPVCRTPLRRNGNQPALLQSRGLEQDSCRPSLPSRTRAIHFPFQPAQPLFPTGSAWEPVCPSTTAARRRDWRHCQGGGQGGTEPNQVCGRGAEAGAPPELLTAGWLRQGQRPQAWSGGTSRHGDPRPLWAARAHSPSKTCSDATSWVQSEPLAHHPLTRYHKTRVSVTSQEDPELQKSCTCVREESGAVPRPKTADGPQLSTPPRRHFHEASRAEAENSPSLCEPHDGPAQRS